VFGVGLIWAQRAWANFVTQSLWPAHLGPAGLGLAFATQPTLARPFGSNRAWANMRYPTPLARLAVVMLA
jgi:hypothetical protein